MAIGGNYRNKFLTGTMELNLVYETAVRSMFPGRKIKIQGRTTQNSNRFDIDLECRSPCGKFCVTTPLHISVRFEEWYVGRNTRTQCSWGHEESGGDMPISGDGQPFTVELECKPQVFSISFNGTHFCDYKHRLRYNTLNNITVRGDAEIDDVDIGGVNIDDASDSETPQQSWDGTDNVGEDRVHVLEVAIPNTCMILSDNVVYETAVRSMFPGRKIKIQGRTTQIHSRFDINLECRSSCSKSCATIPLHVSFRISGFVEDRSIVRNTLTYCSWGHEETDEGASIPSNWQPFTIELECKPQLFSISINDLHFCNYKHRLRYNTINTLAVKGDVEISDVSFSGTPPQQRRNATMPFRLGWRRPY